MSYNFTSVSKDEKEQLKKDALEQIRVYHNELIKDLGISKFDFQMKRLFMDQYKRTVIGVYPSEFEREKGMFVELVDAQHKPLDTERKVYRIAPNKNFSEEYEVTNFGSYLVPVDELRVVNPVSVALFKSTAVTSSDRVLKQESIQSAPVVIEAPAVDAPYSEMTIRDHYAMISGKPVSLKPWLNDLIKSK
jgi:hypothetical protein